MKKYKYNIRTLTNENDISYYILGAFMSDGCIRPAGKNTYSSIITSKDKDWLEAIRDYFDKNIKIETPGNYYKLSLNNKEIGEWFISKNCTPRKSLTVKMPNIPDKYLPDLIRGIFDGDGSLTIYSNKKKSTKDFSSYICSSSIQLLQSIQKILEKKDISSKLIEIFQKFSDKKINKNGIKFVQKNKHWRLFFNKKRTLKFLSFIYYDNHQIRLNRKFEKFNKMKEIYEKEQLVNNQLNKNCKIQWPSDEELIELIKNNTYIAVGKMLGVSNVSIVERMKVRGIYIPKRKNI